MVNISTSCGVYYNTKSPQVMWCLHVVLFTTHAFLSEVLDSDDSL